MAMISVIAEALQIFLKYGDTQAGASQDEFFASETPPESMSQQDRDRLKILGWRWSGRHGCWGCFI